jgi:hypothetical protein
MPGVKGRSGSGGSRRYAGRPRSVLCLSKDAALELSIILRHKRGTNPDLRAEDIIERWIHEEWAGIDALYKEKKGE